jgi:hypothetical protein
MNIMLNTVIRHQVDFRRRCRLTIAKRVLIALFQVLWKSKPTVVTISFLTVSQHLRSIIIILLILTHHPVIFPDIRNLRNFRNATHRSALPPNRRTHRSNQHPNCYHHHHPQRLMITQQNLEAFCLKSKLTKNTTTSSRRQVLGLLLPLFRAKQVAIILRINQTDLLSSQNRPLEEIWTSKVQIWLQRRPKLYHANVRKCEIKTMN